MKRKSMKLAAVFLSLSLICSQIMPVMAEEGDFSETEKSEEVVLTLDTDEMQDESFEEETENEAYEIVLEENEQVIPEKTEMLDTSETAVDEKNSIAAEEKQPESVFEKKQAIEEENLQIIKKINAIILPEINRIKKLTSLKINTASPAIADGRYVPSNWSIRMASGRPLKNPIDCTYVKVSGGQAFAQIVFNSDGFPKLTSDGKEYTSVIDKTAETSTFFIPVEINKDYSIFAESTKMSATIEYIINVTVSDSSAEYTGATPLEENELDENAIPDGRYVPSDWSIGMASGRPLKNPIDCTYVKISGSKTYAQIVFNSDGFPKLTSNGKEYTSVIDETAKTSTFFIPVKINEDYSISAFSTKMNAAIEYVMNITLTKDSPKYEGAIVDESAESDDNKDNPDKPDAPDTPDNPSEPVNPADPDNPDKPGNTENEPVKPVKPVNPDKIADGTYQIKADTDNRMFYMVPKDNPDAYRATLVKKNGKLKVTFTLSGTGYDYLYLGTSAKAAKTDKAKLTKFKESNGYYSYTMEIPALDKELTIAAHSEKQDKWYEHTIIFYSDGAKKVKDGTSTVPDKPKKDKDKDKNKDDKNNTSGTQTDFKNDNKKDKESESKGDTEKSTSAVDSSTGLADGVYTPDKFSWSGGSGRLAYIRCDKITVTDGQAYATIVFSSSSYDQLKANGRVYWNSGSEFSTFVIPVQLNSNNKIVGRTTAMSAAHWIEYSIFIYSNAAAKATGGKEITGESIKTSKLSDKTPEIAGLESKNSTKVKYAKNFKIFNYENGVKLLQMDITKKSGMKYKKEDKKAEDNVEYDDEGKPIAKSQGEITEELYHANVVNYLIVPEGVEIPAGLDKECVVINAPLKNAQISSEAVLQIMDQLGITKYIKATGIEAKEIKIDSISKRFDKEKTFYAGDFAKPDYKEIIKNKIDINILPAEAVAAKIETKDKNGKALSEEKIKEQKKAAKEAKKTLELIEKRYATLGIPVIIDRSASEKDEIANAEWIKVYGALFGCQKEANKLFAEYEKKYKEEHNEQ